MLTVSNSNVIRHIDIWYTVDYSAQLRLPTGEYSPADKGARVAQTVETLRLEKCAGSRIGDGETRGISGGERKRVAIGQELVSNVRVLMLDEPTYDP